MPSAEIVTIGTEILLGEIVDTNTRHIALTLRDLGVDLYRTLTIGDNVERIASAIRDSMEHAEIIITTGGLGPTVDDPTREAVAKAVGVETEFRAELWEQVTATIKQYGRKPAENQKRQAVVPRGAIGVHNPVGTAPAFIVEHNRNSIISLPGVPNEMEHILHESIVPYLQKRFDLHEVIRVRVLHTSGLGEGTVDEKIGDLETLANPTVGLAAHTGIVDIRIAAKADSEANASTMIAEVEAQIRARLGNAVFGVDEDKLEEVVLNLVAERGWTLTAVESGLDGLLARKLPQVASIPDLTAASLMEALRAARSNSNANVALGVTVHIEDHAADMAMITPRGEKTHRITYGGPPRSLPRWALNLALNWLRTVAQEAD
ncbi:MAG TPA: CinA family nicotinamide mononucleotide deamidase-related protein [Anaerolineales bacterium]|nr:CinA family nicotinamide mononucleotide deamidase-related protein [Anaerolineales bacterium]